MSVVYPTGESVVYHFAINDVIVEKIISESDF